MAAIGLQLPFGQAKSIANYWGNCQIIYIYYASVGNPNFILVRDFLLSAGDQLQRGGQVLITAVDTPHYRGAFQFDEAADIAGFRLPGSYPFDPNVFPQYEHTMTHQSGSALDEHDRFRTCVFKK